MKIFCIPYAGGSMYSYIKWKRFLDKDIEYIPLELAGRGRRIKDPHYEDFNEMVNDIYHMMLEHIVDDIPFAIYGHSMGGYIAYELYDKLMPYNMKHLFISGTRAPHLGIIRTNHASDKDLIEIIDELGGTPKDLLDNVEFLNVFLPLFRADFMNLNNHFFKKISISVPATILHGLHEECDLEDVYAWNEYFDEKPNMYFFEGGHFFIQEFEQELITIINQTLASSTVTTI